MPKAEILNIEYATSGTKRCYLVPQAIYQEDSPILYMYNIYASSLNFLDEIYGTDIKCMGVS